jgi:hypothetical protein
MQNVSKTVELTLSMTPSALQIFECVNQLVESCVVQRTETTSAVAHSLIASSHGPRVSKRAAAPEYITSYKFSNFPVPFAKADTCNSK